MKTFLKYCIAGLALIITYSACNSPFTPRPKGYYKIDLPQRAYQSFDSAGFPYSFEYPAYAEIGRADSAGHDPYWINIELKSLQGRIYISYKP